MLSKKEKKKLYVEAFKLLERCKELLYKAECAHEKSVKQKLNSRQ